eukprot:augustus_masked-scaffold_26-processed-gene-4.16-mRNA-1 protein AED:1.00 eAED:1.00 QI:0/0/0/0/1/1/2/0/182
MSCKARLREEQYKEKQILKILDPAEVTKFISEFDIYETTVIRQQFALPSADLSLNLKSDQNKVAKDQDKPDKDKNFQGGRTNSAPQVNQFSSTGNQTSNKEEEFERKEPRKESEIEMSANNVHPVNFPEMYVLEVDDKNELHEITIDSDVESLNVEWDENTIPECAIHSMYRDEISDEFIDR